jgi:uncharacterized protein (TIGR02466 family)
MPLALLFPTPVAMYEHPERKAIDKEITDILVAESLTVPSIANSNRGGWHSPYNLQDRPEACFRKLSELIVKHALETTQTVAQHTGRRVPQFTTKAEMWAMVMRDGDYTVPHTHPYSHWGTVYYPDAGDSDEAVHPGSGVITFMDPRTGRLPIPGLDLALGTFLVSPKSGQLLVFPGWLMHFVHTYRGKRPRVSISCNVTLEAVLP